MAHMPANYDAMVYFQPRTFAQQLQQLRAAVGSTIVPGGQTIIEQIRSVCGTMRFEDGKIRDSIFVGIPRVENVPPINRSSLALGSGDTFFYLATLLNIGDKLDTLSQAPGLSDRLQKLFQTFRVEGTVYLVSTPAAQKAAQMGRIDVVSPDTGPTAIREAGQVKAVR